MSRLTDLLRQVQQSDKQLARDLEAEIHGLTNRRTFGLVFEPHQPEAIELAGRAIRRGDKVRILPPRGEATTDDRRLWRVQRIERSHEERMAHLVELETDDPDSAMVAEDDLVVIAEFSDRIYPGLVETGRVERGGNKPFHTVINAENYHALEMLTYTHRHSLDAIYIDPPYNTGARDWKYNNDYVESDDDYRHSKWLAFMERRLKLARELLNPDDSVLIVTIDEKEYLRLGLLLEQTFPEADVQMITSVTNPKGSARQGRFSRTDEYIYFVMFGESYVEPWNTDMIRDSVPDQKSVRWAGLLRNGEGSLRTRIPSMFYPIYLDAETGLFHSVGEPPAVDVPVDSVPSPEGTVAVWPIDRSGREMMWRLSPASLRAYLEKGYAKFGRREPKTGRRSPSYLQSGILTKIETGDVVIEGYDEEGAAQVSYLPGKRTVQPMTLWNRISHSASEHGASFVKSMLPGRKFPYPKSLFAVEDTLRFFLKNKPEAKVLDFFAGSGTTAHAVMRLNKQDDGHRQCISITNNEVSADEQQKLRRAGFRPGDPEWEALGICDYITKPRITAAITGMTPEGEPIKGHYRFTDEFPIADGFQESAAFFTLTYEAPLSVRHHRSFEQIAPMLWLRAGARGRIIKNLGDKGWDIADAYAILENLDHTEDFINCIHEVEDESIVYVITDDESAFQMVCRHLPKHHSPVRLYESYLQNFQINIGGTL